MLSISKASRLPQARIAVNARCGRACFYCRPSGENIATRAHEMLDLTSVLRICDALKSCGISDFKLTGGDPALWPCLVTCVDQLKNTVGVETLEVISRHPRIAEAASALHGAKLDRINLSIDTLKPDLHRRITGVDDLPELLAALRTCIRTGLRCKVNTVVMHGVNEDEIAALVQFCEGEGVACLKLLDVIRDLEDGSETFRNRLVQIGGTSVRDLYTPMQAIRGYLNNRATEMQVTHQGGLGHPMQSYRLSSGLEVLVKDHRAGAWYGDICQSCTYYPCHDALMAIRVTADARIQFCLLREDIAVDLKPVLAGNADELLEVLKSSLAVYESAAFATTAGGVCISH